GGGPGHASDPRRRRRGARGSGLLRSTRPRQGSSPNLAGGPRAVRPARNVARRLARRREGRHVPAAPPDPREARLMAPTLALRLVTYLLVCNGIASLLLAGVIGPLSSALVVLASPARWWPRRARGRGVVREWIAWALVGAAAIAIAMDLIYLASTALDGMVHLLLFLILARLFLRRSLRDLRDAGFLSFFLLVAASSVTFSV